MTTHPNEMDPKTREVFERTERERKEQERYSYLLSAPSSVRLSEPSSAEIIGNANLSDSQVDALAEAWSDQSSAPAEKVALAAGDPTDELAESWRNQTGQ